MKRVLTRIVPAMLSWSVLSAVAATDAQPHVTLHFNERPPYLMERGGALVGLTGAPAAAAFKRAGIDFTLRATPATRQLELVRKSPGVDCAVGWLKNDERARFAKITRPIYQDRPQIALASILTDAPKTGDTIEAVLGNKELSLLVKQGYSYGSAVDDLMARLQPTTRAVAVENVQMARMVLAGRSDYMLVAPEEADALIAALGGVAKAFRRVALANMPAGETRHILCSRNMPDSLFDKLNRAIP